MSRQQPEQTDSRPPAAGGRGGERPSIIPSEQEGQSNSGDGHDGGGRDGGGAASRGRRSSFQERLSTSRGGVQSKVCLSLLRVVRVCVYVVRAFPKNLRSTCTAHSCFPLLIQQECGIHITCTAGGPKTVKDGFNSSILNAAVEQTHDQLCCLLHDEFESRKAFFAHAPLAFRGSLS